MKIIGRQDLISSFLPADALDHGADDIYLVDVREQVSVEVPKSRLIAVSRGLTSSQVIQFLSENKIQHIVQSSENFDEEFGITVRMIENSKKFVDDPIECIRGTHGQKTANGILKILFNSSTQKNEILGKLHGHLSNLTKSTSTVNDALLIADEMFTNATYNAPNNGSISREQMTTFDDGKTGELTAFTTTHTLYVGCHDPFGSFAIDQTLARLKNIYAANVRKSINMGTGGAGIGIKMIFDLTSSIYIGVEPRKKTVIYCALPLKISRTQISAKGFHYVVI